VHQSVNDGGDHLLVVKDANPPAELQVCRKNDTLPFITVGDDLKEQLGGISV
jgi:hypothetical protein